MRDYQARGYIFESVIYSLLKKSGYMGIESKNIRGRGASHQIDAYAFFKIPTPFIYPIRLLCEAKCYRKVIGLEHIRNYVGVIKDISENYIVGENGERSTPDRFTDLGCYFSISGFSLSAQEYAWAQNIFIISFRGNVYLEPIVEDIWGFTNGLTSVQLNEPKDDIVKHFWNYLKNNQEPLENYEKTDLVVGVIDGIYPITIVGEKDWMKDIDSELSLEVEKIDLLKLSRETNDRDTLFNLLTFNNKKIYFTLPNIIAKYIVTRIDARDFHESIFTIDIPYMRQGQEDNTVRRIFKFDVKLKDQEEYINYLKSEREDKEILKSIEDDSDR